MGVVIKYSVEFPDIGLTVSSDPLAAGLSGLLLDATITCKMTRGTSSSGGSFEVRIVNLPKKKGVDLEDRIAKKTPTNVIIKMGYADGGPFEKVMEGLVDKVRGIVEDDNLTTIINGKEYATHVLQRAKFKVTFPKDTKISDAISQVVSKMEVETGEKRPTVQVDASVTATIGDHTVRGSNVMEELQKLAEFAQAELLVSDGKVLVGTPVQVTYPGVTGTVKLDPNANLGTFETFTKKVPGDNDHDVLKPIPSATAQGFTFLATGDPNMRPGQKVSASFDGFDQTSGEIYRIQSLAHKFGPKDGYVCQGDVLKVNEKDPAAQRKLRSSQQPTAQSLIDNLTLLGKESASGQGGGGSALEIGQVKEYLAPADGEKHQATLYYGQPTDDPTETQPSIHVDVETKDEQIYEKKPFISPFAWHKCGLVVPVYKGMKAVIAHNRNLGDDALVAGFIWSEKKTNIAPPASKTGDWWLCLPVDYDGASPPSDSTKAANDLTANNGKRVIEVKGLKITVGTDKLGNVGARPTEGDDNAFLIEHKSGTSFLIADDGTLTITAKKLSIKGDVTIEGNVEIK